jgi:hypothetical protein
VQISSLQSSQSLTIRLRTCPRHVSHAEWHRHSMSTKKVRRILSELANRYLLQVVRFAQVANDPGWKVRTGGAGASGTCWSMRVYKSTSHESFYRTGQ